MSPTRLSEPPNSMPPTTDPAMPSRMVTMMPPGSRPGMMAFAMAPAIRPMMIIHRMCMCPPPKRSVAPAPSGPPSGGWSTQMGCRVRAKAVRKCGSAEVRKCGSAERPGIASRPFTHSRTLALPHSSSVLQGAAAALHLAAVLLGVQARLAGGLAGARLLPLRLHDQRLAHQLHEALRHRLLVAVLAAVLAGGQQPPPLAADAVGELLADARALLVAHAGRRVHVPRQLHARGRGVHVLAAGAARAGGPVGQLRAGHAHGVVHLEHAVVGHATAPTRARCRRPGPRWRGSPPCPAGRRPWWHRTPAPRGRTAGASRPPSSPGFLPRTRGSPRAPPA